MTDYSNCMPDYIRGKADIFSYAIEFLEKCMEEKRETSSKEFIRDVKGYANTSLTVPMNQYYHIGNEDAVTFIYDYFDGSDYGLTEFTIKQVYNVIEEEFDYLLQELRKRGEI